MIRIVIAEEHNIVRWGLREAFAHVPDMLVVGDAGTIAKALEVIRRERPDIVLLDLALQSAEYDVLGTIRDLEAGPLVVVLARHAEPVYGARTIAAGAHGYVAKDAQPDELLDAIRAVHRGERVMPPDVEALVAAGDGHPAAALTRRELQVMEMIARGMTNREIATDLEISIKTIDTHRAHVLKKLGLRNNSELTRFAVKHGYVTV